MFELVKEGGVLIANARLSYKNRIKDYEDVSLVFDPGCAMTLVDISFMELLGYSAGSDGIRTSNLDGAIGASQGYVISAPFFRCLNQELIDFEIACHDLNSNLGISGLLGMNFFKHFRMDIDFSKGSIYSIERVL